MTVPNRIRITGPEDILGFIPHSLGYWPDNSLVAMSMQGKRLGATLRVDLPQPKLRLRPDLAGFARSVADYLRADDRADGSLLAIFAGDGAVPGGDAGNAASDPGGPGAAAWADLLAELKCALGDAGMPLRDAWIVGARSWRNAYCSDARCCPPSGRSLDEIRHSALNAEMIFRGSSIGPAPRSARAVPRPTSPATAAAERRWARRFAPLTRDRAQFGQVLDVWARAMEVEPPAPAGPGPVPGMAPGLTGYLRASLRVPAWRDAVLVAAAAGRPAAEGGAAAFGMFDAVPAAGGVTALPAFPSVRNRPDVPDVPAGPGSPDRNGALPGYGEVLLGLVPARPDWTSLARLDGVLLGLGEAGPGEARAAALTARGWIEWCRGRGSFADALYNAALRERPGYRLAELLAELARRGTLCGWAARQDAAWQRFAP